MIRLLSVGTNPPWPRAQILGITSKQALWAFIVRSATSGLMCSWCLYKHLYVYHQILRWVVCATGILEAFVVVKEKTKWAAWGYGIVAVLFNPLIPFYMKRETWLIIDVVERIWYLVVSDIVAVRRLGSEPTHP